MGLMAALRPLATRVVRAPAARIRPVIKNVVIDMHCRGLLHASIVRLIFSALSLREE